MPLGNDPYSNGYAAAFELSSHCPHLLWSFDWWCWQWGNYVGHQALCAQHEMIFLQHPQD